MMKYFLSLFVLFSYVSASWAQDESPEPSPNIVFIFADDLGYGDIGLYGAEDVKTPHIDKIGTQGVQFNEFYSASPVCTPSRAALLTGRYPIRMGIHHVFFPNSYAGMPEEEVTIAEVLKEKGYKTAIVGKWHLGHHEKYLPLNQGFDEFFGIPYSNDMPPLPLMLGNEYIESKIDQDKLTQRLTDYAVNFIDTNADQPFFLYVPHPMPHYPLHRSNNFKGVSERGLYGDVIEELDHSVGQIRHALEKNGLSENTLFVFTSDNGPWILMGDDGGSSGHLRNGKGTTFEGGIKVPTVALFPKGMAEKQKVDTPVSMLDWFPTLIEMSGSDLPEGKTIDGQSLLPTLDGRQASDVPRPLYFYSHGKLEAIRMGQWKYKRAFRHENNPVPPFVRPFLGGEVGLKEHGALLFNLSKDPSERNNIITAHSDIAKDLETRLISLENSLGETPVNITPLVAEANPVIVKVMSTIAKLGLLTLALFVGIIAFIFYRLGRRKVK